MTLIDLYRLAECENIEIDAFDLHSRESLSLCDEDGQCFIAIDPYALLSTADEKTKLGHEIGHCLTGGFYNRHSGLDIRQRHENHADKWEIKKLIPKDELDEAVAEGYTEVHDLSDYFDVSEDLMRKALCWYRHGNLATNLYFDIK